MESEYLSRKGRRSVSTARLYGKALKRWAECLGVKDADEAVSLIKSGKLDAYKSLDDFVQFLIDLDRAPKTIWVYFAAVKGFLLSEDVSLEVQKVKAKVELPRMYEVSTDRLPSKEELERLFLFSKLKFKVAITILVSSGMRLGELASLQVGDIDFDAKPVRIWIRALNTKTKTGRYTFLTDEAVRFLKQYLGSRIDNKEDYVWKGMDEGMSSSAYLSEGLMRVVKRAGLLKKLNPESKRYQIHPHCFRKYFFTKLISAGVDRGVAEYLMGHKYGLDSAYLKLNPDELVKHYVKVERDLTILTPPAEVSRDEMLKRDVEIADLKRSVKHSNKIVDNMRVWMNYYLEEEVKAGRPLASISEDDFERFEDMGPFTSPDHIREFLKKVRKQKHEEDIVQSDRKTKASISKQKKR